MDSVNFLVFWSIYWKHWRLFFFFLCCICRKTIFWAVIGQIWNLSRLNVFSISSRPSVFGIFRIEIFFFVFHHFKTRILCSLITFKRVGGIFKLQFGYFKIFIEPWCCINILLYFYICWRISLRGHSWSIWFWLFWFSFFWTFRF